jgi:hypothetical protein
VLIILVALLAGVVAVLAIPVDLAFTMQREEKFQGHASIGWLFGLVRIPLKPQRGKAQPAPHQKQKRAPAESKLHVGAMLRSKGFLARLIRLLRRLYRCLHIRHLRLHVLLGLDDPADTGQLWGVVGPLALAVPVPAGADLAILPEFTEAAFRIDGEGTVRIVPIEIIGTLLAFILSPVTVRALYALGTGR